MHSLKVENYIVFDRLSEDFNPGDSFSDSSEALSPRGRIGIMMYMKYFGRKMYVIKHPSW